MNKKKSIIIGLIVLVVVAAMIMSQQQPGDKNQEISQQQSSENEEQDMSQQDSENEEQDMSQQSTEIDNQEEDFQIVERVEASYENWLAASLVMGVAMQYPDCEIENIYLCSENSLEEKESSEGVYVVFSLEGEEKAVHSVPLSEERQEIGTRDLFTKELGFSTFDEVETASIMSATYEETTLDELIEVIEQTILVTVYER